MSIDTIPVELLDAIFSHLDARKDLAAVRLVCRRWAAEPILTVRTCLKVAHRVRYRYDCELVEEKTRMIDKELLMELNRRFTSLRIECADDWKERRQNRESLEELLDVCQERYSVKKLRLRITPDVALAGLFVKRRDWLQSLTELHVELGSVLHEKPKQNTEIEVTLPVLKRLTWLHEDKIEDDEDEFQEYEYEEEGEDFVERYVPCYTYVLNLPNLVRLKVRIGRERNGIRLKSTLRVDANVCCLFQPRLKLKSYEKLQFVEVEGLTEVKPEYVSNCETLLQNLKSLSFVKCYSTAIQMICEKCTNLEELIVNNPWGVILPLHISPLISRVLKKLTLKGVTDSFEPEREVAFPQLHYLRLIDVTASLISGNVTLVVPQLTTLVVLRSDYELLTIPYKEQIQTMAVELDGWSKSSYVPPPPNVTELFLRQKFEEPTAAQHYLRYFPNLRRLTLYGIDGTYATILNCGVLQRDLLLLEYFHAHEVTLQLGDIHNLKHLKSLILSDCTLTTTPGDREVMLKQVDYFRVKRVTLEGTGWEWFPIYGNERQSPVETVEVFPNGWRTFSSLNFQLKPWAPSNPM